MVGVFVLMCLKVPVGDSVLEFCIFNHSWNLFIGFVVEASIRLVRGLSFKVYFLKFL